MSRPPTADADDHAEARPQRLDVAHLLQILADIGAAPNRFVGQSVRHATACGDRFGNVLCRQDAGQHGIMRALDARQVDEARRAADQRTAGERQFRHRLPAAFGDRARAVGDALAALEGLADRGMRLEALEFLEGRQVGVCNSGGRRSRPRPGCPRGGRGTIRRRSSCRAANRTNAAPGRACAFRLHLPEFLQADAEFLQARQSSRSNFAISCFASEPRAPSPISMYLPAAPCRVRSPVRSCRRARCPCRR